MRRGLIVTALAWALAGAGAPALAEPTDTGLYPYTAMYSVARGRMQIGQMRVTLTQADGGSWLYQSHSRTTGVIGLLRSIHINETTRFHEQRGTVVPRQHVYTLTGDRRDRNFALIFDWVRREVRGIVAGEAASAELVPGMVDRHTVLLQTVLDVRAGAEFPRNVATVDRARIRELVARIDGHEELRTKAGAFNTVRIVQQRIDDPDKRLVLWLAVDERHLPVRVRSVDDDGQTITLELLEFELR